MFTDKQLIRLAFDAQRNAYAPYSNFLVGAALMAKNGKVYQGCNIENAAYGPSNCAERTAFFKAVSEGVTEFEKIAIVGNPREVESGQGEYCAPCGVCRQVMAEFCQPETFEVIIATSVADYKACTLEELLPHSFGNGNLTIKE